MRKRWSECLARLGGTRATFHTDGGAWPMNPGHGGFGIAMLSPDNRVVRLEWGYIGDNVSSNEAEYTAVFRALEVAKEMGLTRVDIRSDSRMVVNQLTGRWEVDAIKFQDVNERFDDLSGLFRGVTLEWIPREENGLADAMVELVRQQDWGDVGDIRVDGRDELAKFLMELFCRNGVEVLGYGRGYINLDRVLVRPMPFYHREAGTTYPSVERSIFEEAGRMGKPVIFAWRPQGMNLLAMSAFQVGRMIRDAGLAEDGRVGPLFAFAADLTMRVPAGKKIFGYRGSRIFILEGPWRTTGEFLWWRTTD